MRHHTTYFIILLLFFIATHLYPAWIDNVPNKLTQPDGTVIDVLYSGDEHHNWAHDTNGYTMIIDVKTGYVCWATAKDGDLTSTGKPVHLYTPQSLNLQPRENISPELYAQKRRLIDDSVKRSPTRTPTTGTINELVVFVRFADDAEYTQQVSYYEAMFNNEGEGVNSLKQYYWDASYNQLVVNSPFYPEPPAQTIISYQDTQPRGYFQEYSANNPIGYTGGSDGNQRTTREHQLLKRAAEYIATEIPEDLDIDSDNDGFVDNVNYVIRGAAGDWAVLLWPHRWVLYSETALIHGKRVWDYNFNIENHMNNSGVSVLAHEFGHSLGAPDYYRYQYDGNPVGYWDLMSNNLNPPQSMSAYTKWFYMGWIPQPPLITTSDEYTLYPNTVDPENHALRIPSPYTYSEYFIVEYRSTNTGMIDSALPGSGLVVWRINANQAGEGNSNGPPDELYVYRQNGSPTSDGNNSQAFLSAESGRYYINDNSNPYAFLSNGQPGGLDISGIGSCGETISFYVDFEGALFPPFNLTAQPDGEGIQLSWTPPDNDNLTGYFVYRDQSTTPLNTNIFNSSTYTDLDVSIGNIYSYTVKAVYTVGESILSNPVQAVLIHPVTSVNSTFEDGSSGGWMINNGSQYNFWIVQDGASYAGDYSIYITNNEYEHEYTINQPSIVHFFRDITFTSPDDNTISFYFIGRAEGGYDYLRVYICEITNVPMPGSLPVGTLLGEYSQENNWSQKVINLPAMQENTTKRIVFTWRNDGGVGDQPPAGVDNIVINGGSSVYDDTLILAKPVLRANYPNPFNPSTTIAFDMASPGQVVIDIYNIKGQRVKRVVSGSFSGGKHSVVWNGDDSSGHAVGSGVYFYRMVSGDFVSVRKMVLMK